MALEDLSLINNSLKQLLCCVQIYDFFLIYWCKVGCVFLIQTYLVLSASRVFSGVGIHLFAVVLFGK